MVALLSGDRARAERRLSADVLMEVAGAFRATGRAEAMAGLVAADALEIDTVVTHGRAGAVSGRVVRGGRTTPFAMVFRFASAKAEAVQHIAVYSPEPHSLVAGQ